MYSFGSGALFGYPTVLAGAPVTNGTPIEFATLQDISVDFSFGEKELFGRNAFANVTYRGKGKVTAKAKYATLRIKQIAEIFFGQTPSVGGNLAVFSEGPLTLTSHAATVANSATFAEDLGVVSVQTGLAYVKVASGPLQGQYSVSAGVYTFNSSETSTSFYISYTYTPASNQPSSILVQQQPLGLTTFFVAEFYSINPNTGDQLGVKFWNAMSNKFSLATKTEDFTIPDFDLSFSQDTSGRFVTIIGSN